jgi:transposase
MPAGNFFIGIDYHKRYSVHCVLDEAGAVRDRGRISHACPGDFAVLLRKWPGSRVVFEASMNWHWLYELIEREVPKENIVLANPFKTRIIAEAQVKTDKIDAQILARLLRAELIAPVHIACRATRERKEVLRQRCFFVRQRTMLRNRIHRLLGAQHDVELPQLSDLFGRKGVAFLHGLKWPAPAGLLLKQQLEILQNLGMRIKEDEQALEEMMEKRPNFERILSLPGMGPILAAVVDSEPSGARWT